MSRSKLPVLLNSNQHFSKLFMLFLVRSFWSVGYAIFYGSLSLVLNKHLKYDIKTSSEISGIFVFAGYVLPLIGGWATGRILSNRAIYLLCNLIQCGGLLLVYLNPSRYLILGLSLFLIGTVTNVTSINIIIQEQYTNSDKNRNRSFLWSYSAINIGFIIAYYINNKIGLFHYSQIMKVSCAFLIASMVIFYFASQSKANKNYAVKNILIFALFLVLLAVTLNTIFLHPHVFHKFMAAFGIIVLIGLLYACKKSANKKFNLFISLLILACFFWGAYFITPTILFSYVDDYVPLKVLGVAVSSQWIGAMNSVIVLIGCPLYAIFYNKFKFLCFLHDSKKAFIFALGCMVVGYAFLVATSIYSSGEHVSFWGPAGFAIFQSIGEIIIAPLMYSVVGELVEKKFQNVMSGFTVFPLAAGSLISVGFSNEMLSNTPRLYGIKQYEHIFLMILIALLVVTLLYAISAFMRGKPK